VNELLRQSIIHAVTLLPEAGRLAVRYDRSLTVYQAFAILPAS
jgi:hypothetical protein